MSLNFKFFFHHVFAVSLSEKFRCRYKFCKDVLADMIALAATCSVRGPLKLAANKWHKPQCCLEPSPLFAILHLNLLRLPNIESLLRNETWRIREMHRFAIWVLVGVEALEVAAVGIDGKVVVIHGAATRRRRQLLPRDGSV